MRRFRPHPVLSTPFRHGLTGNRRDTPGRARHRDDRECLLGDGAHLASRRRSYRIGVQSRATKGRWPGESNTGFYYLASKKHIDFWMSGTQPVLLVCSRPDTNEIYARSIQEWGADAAARATRRVSFDKQRDSFDADFRDRLLNLKVTEDDHVEPPGPSWESETLTTNLMPIVWQAESLYSAEVPTSDAKVLLEPARRKNVHDVSAVLRDGMVWSLGPFREGFLNAIDASHISRPEPDPRSRSASRDLCQPPSPALAQREARRVLSPSRRPGRLGASRSQVGQGFRAHRCHSARIHNP